VFISAPPSTFHTYSPATVFVLCLLVTAHPPLLFFVSFFLCFAVVAVALFHHFRFVFVFFSPIRRQSIELPFRTSRSSTHPVSQHSILPKAKRAEALFQLVRMFSHLNHKASH